MICRWQENLPEEDMPPVWMWPLDHELERHFAEVERRREAERQDPSDRDSGPMQHNDLVPDSIRSRRSA